MVAGDSEGELAFQGGEAGVRVVDQHRAHLDVLPGIAHDAEHRLAVDHLVDVGDEDGLAGLEPPGVGIVGDFDAQGVGFGSDLTG
jgi:hypothetical protein